MHFSARVVWITTFRGYVRSVESEQAIRNIRTQPTPTSSKIMITAVRAAQREGWLIRQRSHDHPVNPGLIFAGKTFGLIFNLSQSTKTAKAQAPRGETEL